jgi:hypothetical protein
MLTKPWNPYVYRHSGLTEKSQILKESILRSYADGLIITICQMSIFIILETSLQDPY